MKTKESKVLTVTWSDCEKKEESKYDEGSENFTIFMNSVVEATETSSKTLETEESDESNGIVGSLEKESDRKKQK